MALLCEFESRHPHYSKRTATGLVVCDFTCTVTNKVASYNDPQDDLGETEPLNARTGCIGCPLVQEDSALERVLTNPQWAYLVPLRQLRPLYWEVKKPQYRLRKHGEVNKDGSLSKKQGRLGPLTLETREWMLGEILRIQEEVNVAAAKYD